MTALAAAPSALADLHFLRPIMRLTGPAILAHSLRMVVHEVFVASLGSAAVAAVALVQSMSLAVAALGCGVDTGAASQG